MPENERESWLERLRSGLVKSRTSFTYQIKNVFKGRKITAETWEELEAILIGADVGVDATISIVENLRSQVEEEEVFDPEGLIKLLEEELTGQLVQTGDEFRLEKLSPTAIILIVGVNGTGKTTTIGKMAHYLIAKGGTVVLVAADTFRAAAIEQLEQWAIRSGSEFIKHQRGSDPAAVVYDAVQSVRARGYNYAIVDTAGRLHTYINLMEELKKIKRVAIREARDIPVYTLLAIDATTGQNGIQQAKTFHEALTLDGLILTKLDGTAKGGIVVAVQRDLGVPISLIGVGEGLDDLRPFNAGEFVTALLE